MGDPTCDHKLVFTQLLVLTFVFVFRRLDIVHRRHCFRLMRDWKLESYANGKEISAVPFRTEKEEYL